MKTPHTRLTSLAPAIAVLGLLLPAALAEPPAAQADPRPQQNQRDNSPVRSDQAPTAGQPGRPGQNNVLPPAGTSASTDVYEKASKIIGASVEGADANNVGKVSDLAVDLETGRVLLVIVEHGGIAGVGGNHAALPPAAFSLSQDGKTLRTTESATSLKGAPKFDLSAWDEATDVTRLNETYRRYGQEYNLDESRQPRTALPRASTPPASRTDRQVANVVAKAGADAPADQVRSAERASKIIGATIRNLADDKLGSVDELLLDLPGGRIMTVVISSGGFLGIGDDKSVIPPLALQWDPKAEVVHLDASREKLMAAPRFRNAEWPNQDRDYVGNVYRIFGFEPYRDGTGDVPNADNTAINRRERDGDSLTPLDQSNKQPDVDLTARIRRALVAQDGLSINARNVKVITVDNKVTLRGTVNSEEEKNRVAEIAAGIAGADQVNNQLLVKQALSRN